MKGERLEEWDSFREEEGFDLNEYEKGLEPYDPTALAKRLAELLEQTDGDLGNAKVRATFQEFSYLFGVWLRECELPC